MSGSTGFFGSDNKEDNKMDKQTFVKILRRPDLSELSDDINALIEKYPEYKLDSVSHSVDMTRIVNKLDHPDHIVICVFEKR